MHNQISKIAVAVLVMILQVSVASAQDDNTGGGVQFNGLGRTNLDQSGIGGDILKGDSTTPRNLTNGAFLLDLKINAQPNKKTEVQSILRLRNEFGGFFGAGMSIEVRELWASGVIANAVKYRVGDMDLVMTPFTLFNSEPDGRVNEPAIFKPQEDVIDYENFYTPDHTRRMQGANLDFGLKFSRFLKDMDAKGFITRVRGTDFLTVPSRFVTGGELKFSTVKISDSLGTQLNFGFNYINIFDDLKSGDANTGIRNSVPTVNYDLTVFENKKHALHILGEGGFSKLVNKNDSTTLLTKKDGFFDGGAKYLMKDKKLTFYASYLNVGPDFFSMGAQSKEIDYTATKTYWNRAGESQQIRQPTLFDMSRDPAIYTFRLSDQLMAYDPRFSNTFPYGRATPNRQGVTLDVDYGDDTKLLQASVNGAMMKEIRGQGTNELKSFDLAKAAATLNLSKPLSWNKKLKLTLGYQYEKTSRGGVPVEKVDLKSNLVELGLEAELFKDFEWLAGAKLLQAKGSDYIPVYSSFNIVQDFPGRDNINDNENLLATGFKYTFKEGVYITLQYQHFTSSQHSVSSPDYNLNQIFVLYTMKF